METTTWRAVLMEEAPLFKRCDLFEVCGKPTQERALVRQCALRDNADLGQCNVATNGLS